MTTDETISLLKENIRLWKLRQPTTSKVDFSFEELSCASLVKNQEGYWNLSIKDGDDSTLLYQQNPIEQERQWSSSLFEVGKPLPSLLIIYGIGLGYSYEILRKWLDISPQHRLVYLEDNPAVIHCFFQTENAELLLKDPRVRLCYLNEQNKDKVFYDLARHYTNKNFKFAGQLYYLQKKSFCLIQMKADLEHYFRLVSIADSELSSFGKGFYTNYFPNLFEAVESTLASGLFGLFASLPVIVVGAGPSLNKNIHLLKEIKNRALIIAGGTAVNALNAAGIDPHICVGIDPNPSHALRALTSTSFQTPLFFHGRMYHPILKIWHGDHCFLNGSVGYPFTAYIEKLLGIESPPLDEGFNVVTLSLSLAKALGCKSIATVGMDLSYSQELTYSNLTPSHPLDQPREGFRSKSGKEDLVLRSDIYQRPVLSLWKWIQESMWIGKFALENTSIDVVNATEGGIGFPGVENMTLQEFIDKHCEEMFDVAGLVHAAIQCCGKSSALSFSNVYSSLEQVKEGLQSSIALLKEAKEQFGIMRQQLQEGVLPKSGYVNDALMQLLLELQKQEIYTQLLFPFDGNLQSRFEKDIDEVKRSASYGEEKSIHDKILQLHEMRYTLLIRGAEELLDLITSTLSAKSQEKDLISRCEIKRKTFSYQPKGVYEFTEKGYKIEDKSLDVSYSDSEGEAGIESEEFSCGSFRGEVKKKGHKLHGPFRLYSHDDVLLYESWFVNGSKEGAAVAYTSTGCVHFIEGYVQGKLHGECVYCFSDGSIKAKLHYSHGVLEGGLEQYHQNGQLKRKQSFHEGKKDGEELLCQENGQPVIEAFYEKGVPVGEQKYYDHTGKILRRAVYSQEGELDKLFMVERDGSLVSYPLERAKDYYEMVSRKIEVLTDEIEKLLQELQSFTSAFVDRVGKGQEQENELLELSKEIENLQQISRMLIQAAKKGVGPFNEKIWQTPTNKGMLNEQLLVLKGHLQKCIRTMRENLLSIAAQSPKE